MLRRLFWLTLVFLFLALAKNYIGDYAKLQDIKEKNQTLETKIATLHQEIARLKEEEERLTNDPEYIERRARSKLKMSKEGEVILKY